jgi:hypothetical protein
MAASEATAGSGDERKITCCAALFLSPLRSRAMARDLRVRVRGILDGVVVKFLLINTVAVYSNLLLCSQGFQVGTQRTLLITGLLVGGRGNKGSALQIRFATMFDIGLRREYIAGRDTLRQIRQTSLGSSIHSESC